MNKFQKNESICGPDCRYRALYEGSQTSLTDMAHRQAQALSRVGRLRMGTIAALRRNFSRSFQEAERALGHRLNEVDDEVLLAYVGAIMAAAPAAAASAPHGLEELRTALQEAGMHVPLGTDLESWAEALRSQNASASVVSDELSEIFGTEPVITKPLPRAPAPAAKLAVPPPPAITEPEPVTKPKRRTLQSLSQESMKLETTLPETRDDLASVFNFIDEEPPADYDLPFDEHASQSSVFLDEENHDASMPLPPADPYSQADLVDDSLPFPMAQEPVEEEPAKPRRTLSQAASSGVDPKLAVVSNAAAENISDDNLASLFSDENEQPQERPLSRSAMRRRRKNQREASSSVKPPIVDTSAPDVEINLPASLTETPPLMRAPWVKEDNVPVIEGPQVSLPEGSGGKAEETSEEIVASIEELPFKEAVAPAEAPTAPEAEPAAPEAAAPRMVAPSLRPELYPMMTAKASSARARRPANKSVRTKAAPPDGRTRLFDVPDVPAELSEPGAVISDELTQAITAAVAIPRPVFTSDLASVAGSPEIVKAWETECRANQDKPVRFIAAKARHQQRGSLVLPGDSLRKAATEFKRSVWGECMERYRGAVLYEIAVLLHRIEHEVVGYQVNEHTLTLRLSTRRGLVGVVVVLGSKLRAGEMTRAALAADLESLLSERLTTIAVLSPRAEAVESICAAVLEEAKTRQWAPATPVIADLSWDYAQNRGATSIALLGV